ncbi:hypothetical protein [Pseudoduganella umbonata]|uniref:Uncharacterized protein n=1 Tax=Pseudoduganella umbonata TaxID=864828 RepID=A0A4V1EDT6_9BURK|nr:hypothetical protein [Pseudoduganella umbonata]MBB3220243.1 hypothetical protein [Pseudoduganella umbonata]QCP12211.1 hypothetical protein FCL38_18610 [Pseudoduganella umbonata]
MQKTKQSLLFALAVFAAPLAIAAPAPVADAASALSQPATQGASAAQTVPAAASVSSEHRVRVTQQAAAQAAVSANTALPNWSMLLVGAGVLLLPRKRRVDNSVR